VLIVCFIANTWGRAVAKATEAFAKIPFFKKGKKNFARRACTSYSVRGCRRPALDIRRHIDECENANSKRILKRAYTLRLIVRFMLNGQ